MSYKNMFRLARALHFSNAEDSEVHYALHMLEKLRDENEEYARTKATKMREKGGAIAHHVEFTQI